MSKINILPAQVYNRIAAGEVVDRPYSVVKELVENAIDAGATEIEIYVESGGKQLVRVVDNGGGILREDLQAAFLPHATSKIAKADDLERILTLGFRGEAVASIAAVSKMTITSKVPGERCYQLASDGGKLGEIKEAAGDDGTDVKVEMLFFNTPVRLGFLKSDKAEETDITNFVSRFILNRPNISFRYYVNGKKILQSFGGGEEEAVVGVYGASVLKDCYKLDAEKHGIRIRGYIGNQNFSKPNKTYQSVFLNGRYIVNSTIAAAVANAYASYLMKRQYPFYILYIDVPTEIVDVNVHPNKADVRFADNQIIYGCIYSVVSNVLDGNSKALEYVVPDKNVSATQETFSTVPERAQPPHGNTPPPSFSEKRSGEMPLKSDKASGFAAFTYEDAKREIEKAAPQFSVQKQNSAKGEIELPFAIDDGEDTSRKTPEARGGAMEKDKEKESDLRDAFDDLHIEKNV
ncbi:MAG: DNA mismatch repair endonuclease MutL [Firmicutes bacterium]|nr:DNA mismatch repair endonuclease MutL [Bacillota bacterium]